MLSLSSWTFHHWTLSFYTSGDVRSPGRKHGTSDVASSRTLLSKGFFVQAHFKFVKQCVYGKWPSYKTKMIYDIYELPTKNGDWWWFTYQTYI